MHVIVGTFYPKQITECIIWSLFPSCQQGLVSARSLHERSLFLSNVGQMNDATSSAQAQAWWVNMTIETWKWGHLLAVGIAWPALHSCSVTSA